MISVEKFRERLNPPKRPKTDWSKWIGSPTAWLALMLSGFSAYFTVIRKADELGVIVRDTPIVVRTLPTDDLAVINFQQDLSFTNAGNRPAAITNIALLIWTPERKEERCPSDSEPKRSYDYDFQSVVVRPGDIVTTTLSKFSNDQVYEPTYIGSLVRLMPRSEYERNAYVVVCLSFRLLTPSNAIERKQILLSANEYVHAAALHASNQKRFVRSDAPHTLIQRRGTIFAD